MWRQQNNRITFVPVNDGSLSSASFPLKQMHGHTLDTGGDLLDKSSELNVFPVRGGFVQSDNEHKKLLDLAFSSP